MRIFRTHQGHSREIYHTKRMQHIFSVKYSMDAKFVLCGSDDGNVRVWKANASERLGPVAPRQRASVEYSQVLKERYKHMPQVKQVLNNRQVPKAIKSAKAKKHEMLEARKRKKINRQTHSKEGEVNFVPLRKSTVVTVEQ
jgi:WD repeat and SOF domain-containing protein 1